jgi:hypothetical protein
MDRLLIRTRQHPSPAQQKGLRHRPICLPSPFRDTPTIPLRASPVHSPTSHVTNPRLPTTLEAEPLIGFFDLDSYQQAGPSAADRADRARQLIADLNSAAADRKQAGWPAAAQTVGDGQAEAIRALAYCNT